MAVPQLPLNLRAPAGAGFEDFEGDPALLDLLRAAARGERSEWIYLHGPAGSGRSHLLLAACAEARRAGREVHYLPLRLLGAAALQALQQPAGPGLVAVDDLDAAAGDAELELALFALHNRAVDAGGQLLYAAEANAQSLALGLPDLRSRLQHCSRFALLPLDEAGRRGLFKRRAKARGLELEDGVIDYLFRHHPRDLPALSRLLDRLDRESLAAKRRVTVPFLRQLLGG